MIDAQNGEILNFYFSTESFKETDKKRSEDEKATMAEEIARRLAGDKFDQTVAEIEGNSFEFVRQVNGMDFVGDGISINYDEKRDVIYSYSINWTEVENFPGTDDVMSACDAAKVIADRIGYELCYIGGRPVYDFGHKNYSVFSPYTGNPLKYNGTEYMDEKTPGYNDIAGHWSEKTVNKLLENNISLGGESFLPDQFITQKDFVKFVYYSYGFEDDADIEEFIKSRDLFETVNLKGMVTRNDASRVFAERLGYSELAEKVEIFVKPFADCNDEYAGYVAVCKAFGILSGDGDGNFRGNDGITRAESAVLIYNYICR